MKMGKSLVPSDGFLTEDIYTANFCATVLKIFLKQIISKCREQKPNFEVHMKHLEALVK